MSMEIKICNADLCSFNVDGACNNPEPITINEDFECDSYDTANED